MPKISVGEPFCAMCQKISDSDKVYGEEGGVSRFTVENFLSQSAEKLRRGTFLCFKKSLVSKNVRDKRGGGYHDLPSKISCLRVPKNFVEEPFCVSENLWYRKMLGTREGVGITIFRQNCFVSRKKYRKTS